MTEKAHNSEKLPLPVMSHNKNYASKTPPGTLRMAHCPECKGNYYGSEAEHRARFHGEPYEMYK